MFLYQVFLFLSPVHPKKFFWNSPCFSNYSVTISQKNLDAILKLKCYAQLSGLVNILIYNIIYT